MSRVAQAVAAALIAVLLAACAALAGSIGTTRAEVDVAVDVDLGLVLPGETVTRSHAVEIPELATVVRSDWVRRDGLAQEIAWDIQLCGDGQCQDVAPPLTGGRFAPGSYTLEVAATLPETVSAGTGSALGVVTLQSEDTAVGGDGGVDSEGGGTGVPLPVTGGTVPWAVVALAGGALAAGGFAIALARPRREREGVSS
ncbi:hypothetical protein [Demequina sp. NBRC 110051]|uniref:hypothetical protein n=1 Tax=Demequina sp. NBRC 110051 TaxID=1570340 RepID=UPI000A020F7C|nr:hypothetical protein [Demequina sp. NBRC 110051]